MSVLDSVIEWAQQDLEDWQSDAVRRLLTQETLGEEDYSQLTSMVKGRHGLADPDAEAVAARPLHRGDVSGAPESSQKVVLKAMKNLQNVNRLPPGSGLRFARGGLTVVYGENATGKSGYARVLKRACRARDTAERILPDVFSPAPAGPAKASFKVCVDDGPDEEALWEDGAERTDVLTSIAVFDSKCARLIVDENVQGDAEVAYLPYGGDVFPRLVQLLATIRARLQEEKPSTEAPDFPGIPPDGASAKFVAGLTPKTTTEVIDNMTSWSGDDEKDLARMRNVIAAADDPTTRSRVSSLRSRAQRVRGVAQILSGVDGILSDERIEKLRGRIANLASAQRAMHEVSEKSLAREPLPGSGGSAWELLYRAAKEYSTKEAYPGQDFPQTGRRSRCVLCMQRLGRPARRRLQAFKGFMEQNIKAEEETASQALDEALKEIQSVQLDVDETHKDVFDEATERDKKLALKLNQYIRRMACRAEAAKTLGAKHEVSEIPAADECPAEELARMADALNKEADEIEKAATPDDLKKLRARKDELEARESLALAKSTILDYVERLALSERYDAAVGETASVAITRRGKAILSGALTPELREALATELEDLRASHLPLALKAVGSAGETSHKMQLRGSVSLPRVQLTDILSEGEQRVVAIAGFLAELSVSHHECPIVFDDPVSSLDHRYRDKIAKRLAKEAVVRQVIVFTHDICFLLALEEGARKTCPKNAFVQTVHRYDNVGMVRDGLPWHAQSVNVRLNHLRGRVGDFADLHPNRMLDYNHEAGVFYDMLRATWEAAIEEVLFNKVVRRFGPEIQTLRLKGVTVDPDDYAAIEAGMDKCNASLIAHDKSDALDADRPSPEELKADIEQLQSFINNLNKRRKELGKDHDAIQEQRKPEVG